MFRKDDKDDKPQDGERRPGAEGDVSAPPLKPFSRKGSHAPAKPPSNPSYRNEVPRRVVDIPGVQRRPDRPRAMTDDPKCLIVGRDIELSGEITSCERLVVEGRVEAVLNGAHVIEVAETGLFKGEAHVDEAEIRGKFEGTIIARDVLTVRNGGRVSGKMRYGRIVIESGGVVSGDMQALDDPQAEHGED